MNFTEITSSYQRVQTAGGKNTRARLVETSENDMKNTRIRFEITPNLPRHLLENGHSFVKSMMLWKSGISVNKKWGYTWIQWRNFMVKGNSYTKPIER
jgi:hypothetical protein